VPLHFDPSNASQFDWSEDFAVLGGERAKLQIANELAHSRAFLLRAHPLQTHEILLDAHWHAFRVFGGVPGHLRHQAIFRRWSKDNGEGAWRWIVSAATRNGRSTFASSP
jgi:transposase